jgi:2-hydroxychromene-2-carboxylate isomerase
MTKTIDYFFSIGSPWSFIGHDAFVDLARRFGAEIRPILTTVIEENGGIYARNRPDARRAYWTKDLKRWSAVRGKALNFDNRAALSDPTPASFSVIAADIDGKDWAALTIALQEAFSCTVVGNPIIHRRFLTLSFLPRLPKKSRKSSPCVRQPGSL